MKKGRFLSLAAFSVLAANAAVFDVHNFGAKGDGIAKDTVLFRQTVV